MEWQTAAYGMVVYLAAINLAGFLLMGLDKWKAKHKKWRISEKMLFAAAVFGGSLGTWAGMYAFRHKTRHWYFVVGIPLILAVQIGAVWFLLIQT